MTPSDFDEVRIAITRDGEWRQHVEWRISTITTTRIRATGEPAHRAYHVRVECDYVLQAHCPTLTRAVEIARVYEELIPELWQRHGWPGWASMRQLEPGPGAV
ncbi:MAG TPA: hypothetical protein VJ650_16175 [Gemmatimonadaceae bacterium]|nr:hypothetical protein [Gemmatimonadaceae bacterium]